MHLTGLDTLRLPIAGVIAVLALMLSAACGEEDAPAPARPTATATSAAPTVEAGRMVTDMTGREVAVPEEIGRVVALSPSAVELLYALGVTPVGRVEDAVYPPEVAEVPTVGSSLAPDFEAAAALEPDVVIADASLQGGRGDDFDRFPRPVYVIEVRVFEDVAVALTQLGALLGREDEAAAQVTAIEATAARLAAEAVEAPVRVAILNGAGRDALGLTAESYAGSLAAVLGAENVVEAGEGGLLPGFSPVEIELLALTQPDVVLIVPGGEGEPLAAQLAASAAWAGVPAVANGRVYEIDRDLFLRAPGPRVGEALETLAALLRRPPRQSEGRLNLAVGLRW